MGQRHQIYFRIPKKFYNAGNSNNRPEQTVGWHNQWSYGTLPLRNVARIVAYMKGHYDGIKGAVNYIDSDNYTYVMSYDAASQVVSRYYPMGKVISSYGDALDRQTDENDVLEDPRIGDNNDGITVLDFAPCLKGLPPTYCFMALYDGHLGNDENTVKALTPLTASQYLAAYYPQGVASENAPSDLAQTVAAFDSLGLKTMTLARVKKIFPKMFKKEATK